MEAIDHRSLRWLDDRYRGRLTAAGRACLWGSVAATTLLLGGLSRNLAYTFAFFASVMGWAWLWGLGQAIPVQARRRLPPPASAGEDWAYDVAIQNLSARPLFDLLVEERHLPAELRPIEEPTRIARIEPGAEAIIRLRLHCRLRGLYTLENIQVSRAAPSGLVKHGVRLAVSDRVVVYPRFNPLEHADIPLGKTHQPGGIPAASQVGESAELHGLRPWREGDRMRDVHWPTFARNGQLVVREFQEEYFARLALVVDIAAPRAEDDVFVEKAISMAAAITDALARQDFLIDIFAAGDAVHRFGAGRATDAMDHVLELLAGLETGTALPTEALLAVLAPEAPRLSAVFLVLTHWDPVRAALVEQVRGLNLHVRVLCTRPGVVLEGLSVDETLVLP